MGAGGWKVILATAAAALVWAPGAWAVGCPGAAGGCPYTGVAVFGQQGSGTFRFPQAVAVDRQGDVYVADQYSFVVQRFSPLGVFLGQFGSYGSREGELGAVGGLAVDRLGRINVLDSSHDRVEQFTPEGALVRSWGSPGSGPGQFRLGDRTPVAAGGIAAAGDSIYVADTFNDRVQQFTVDGRFVRAFGGRKLKRPQGLAATAEQVLVADDNDHRLVRFSHDGVYQRVGGSYGQGPGQLRYPYDVALDAAGDAWVADNIGARIVEFDAQLRPKAVFGRFGTARGQFRFPRSLAVDPVIGRVYVADTANNRIQVLDLAGHVIGAWGVSGRGPGNLTLPSDVTGDGPGRLAIADTINDRVEMLDGQGSPLGSLAARLVDRPLGVATLGGDGLAVSDTYHDRVVRVSPDGSVGPEIGAGPGSGPGQFHSPHGIARGILGDIYIADTGNDRVAHFDANGRLLGELRGLSAPEDVSVDPLGQVYVADSGAGEIVKYSLLGNVVSRWGGFDHPASVAVSGLKSIYVADAGRGQIVVLDTRGRRQAAFGAPGTLPGEFIRPAGIAVDAAGDLVVADPRNNRVELFTFGHSAPQSAAPAQQPPAEPPAELVGRLLVPRRAVPARRPVPLGCRASRPGFCRVSVRYAGRIIARGRVSLPVAGVARRLRLRLPASFVRHARGRIDLRVSALFRDGAGERVTATESLIVSGRSSRKGRARGRRGRPGWPG